MKKIISVMLCLSMLCGLMTIFSPLTAASTSSGNTPEGTPVSTVDEFLAMSSTGTYYLANDIDFSGKTYNRNVYTSTFKGVLDGNGHALLGITVTGSNADAGIFGNSFSGTLKNLTIGSADNLAKISSTGAGLSVAAVAATMSTGANFDNVTIYADIKGDGKTAGFTSYMQTGKITISNSRVYGKVQGNPAAGFVTMSHDGQSEIEIRNSVNYADVTGANLGAGGIYATHADVNGSRVCHLTIVGCANRGNITASDWRVGGIVGEFNESTTSSLTVDYCYNTGNVTMTGQGGYAAGIVGGMCFAAPTGARKVSNVYNAGTVTNTAKAENAFSLCYAVTPAANVTLTNAAYFVGTPTKGVTGTNVVQATTSTTDDDNILSVVRSFGRSDDGCLFVADLSEDNGGYPILNFEASEHENVTEYDCGRKYCNDCEVIISSPDEENHTYDKKETAPSGYLNGFNEATCKYCGEKTVLEGKASTYAVTPTDGVYKIGTADALMWYAANVNAGLLSGKETLVLSADIDMAGKTYVPVGTEKTPFRGTLDGALHTIKNLTVTGNSAAGLIGFAGVGAKISNLAMDSTTINAKGNAGALLGEAVSGAIVTIENVVLVKANVTSSDNAAGSLIGSTANSNGVTISQAVSSNATVNGKTAGGLVGNADGTTMTNCYVNADVTSPNAATRGYLANYSGRFTQKYCGYVANGSASRRDGTAVTVESFTNGDVAYHINALSANFIFGVKDDAIVFSETAMRRVRLGSDSVYTQNLLSANNKVALYTAEADGGVTLTFAVARASGVKLMDLEIKVTDNGKTDTINFSDLTLTRYTVVGDTYYSADGDVFLYTVTLDGVSTSATYSVGSVFSGAATVLK